MKYNVLYNDEKVHQVAIENNTISIDGKPTEIDIVHIYQQKYHAIDDSKSYNIEVINADFANKVFNINVNGNEYTINLEDELDILLEQMGMSTHGSDKMDNVLAPMPGLVLNVFVEVGQEVQKGDNLLVLEAMKMENIIKATGTGKVKNIVVNQKQAVDKNQLLIEME
jgi:biotin carboxyl carrier protein